MGLDIPHYITKKAKKSFDGDIAWHGFTQKKFLKPELKDFSVQLIAFIVENEKPHNEAIVATLNQKSTEAIYKRVYESKGCLQHQPEETKKLKARMEARQQDVRAN